jgi:hypothetical protein
MCSKIRCDGESEKFCKIFGKLNRALANFGEEAKLATDNVLGHVLIKKDLKNFIQYLSHRIFDVCMEH